LFISFGYHPLDGVTWGGLPPHPVTQLSMPMLLLISQYKNTHSATVSSGVQVEKSAFGMNFLFIGVSSVALRHTIYTNSKEQLSNVS